jgi:hypothetical protein
VKREKNGVLYVGKTTFEELTAVFVAGLVSGAAAPAEPVELKTDSAAPAENATSVPAVDMPTVPAAPKP